MSKRDHLAVPTGDTAADWTFPLIDAAGKHAQNYDDDDRPCIVTDVMNAFYQGAAWGRKWAEKHAAEQPSAPAKSS